MMYNKHIRLYQNPEVQDSNVLRALFKELHSLAEGLELDYENGYSDRLEFARNEHKYNEGCKILKMLIKRGF